MDVSLPFNDAKVAAKLCIGGPVKYELKEGAGITDQWIVTKVTPVIASEFGKEMAITLGKCLLWGIFDNDFAKLALPDSLVTSVRESYYCLEARELD